MKVKCKVREITEKELDLEYPIYLSFQDELCYDTLVKLYLNYELVVSFDVFGVKIEKRQNPFYEEHQILNNLTTEEHFNNAFEEAVQQIVKLKSGL